MYSLVSVLAFRPTIGVAYSLVSSAWCVLFLGNCTPAPHDRSTTVPDTHLLYLSEELLLNVRTETATDSLEDALAALSYANLRKGLSDDNARKVFWINMYNAWYQILAIDDGVDKMRFSPERRSLSPGCN